MLAGPGARGQEGERGMWNSRNRNEGGYRDVPGKEKPAEPGDAAEWVRAHLGFEPDRGQALMLGSASKRGLLNCTRQWGKSTIAAAKAVYQACTGYAKDIIALRKTDFEARAAMSSLRCLRRWCEREESCMTPDDLVRIGLTGPLRGVFCSDFLSQ